MLRKNVPFAALILLLAACATPEQRCVNNATRDLRTVNALIAETEGNLARGYAIERELESRPRLTFCTGSWRSNFGVNFCTGNQIVYRDRPVAFDPVAERRKLAMLKERQGRLEAGARRNLEACRASG